MGKESDIFFGNRVATSISIAVAVLCTVLGFFLFDLGLGSYQYREGLIENYWHSGGQIEIGSVAVPRPNEQGAQGLVITSSTGIWKIELYDLGTGKKELVECGQRRPSFRKGETLHYKQKLGRITGIEYGLPTCM